MNHRSLFFAICFIFVLGIAACTAVPQPTPSPEAAAEIVTMPTKRPSATPTISQPTIPTTESPTATVSPTPTKFTVPFVPTRTETPIRPTATSTATPTTVPIAWSTSINEIIRVGRVNSLVWSPTANEFVSYGDCHTGKPRIYFANMLQPTKVEITPKELLCYVSILWHPSGEFFFFSSESAEEWRKIEGWQVDAKNLALSYLENQSYYWGWLNNELQISEEWSDPGMFFISLTNFTTGNMVSATYFEGATKGTSQNFVILNEELGYSFNTSVAILAQEEISPDIPVSHGGHDVKYLGKLIKGEWRPEYLFYSRFMDVFPNSDEILVLTWEKDVFEPFTPQDVLTGIIPANLQVWDATTDELVLVKEGGIYGRFSPSGNELVTLTASPDSPQLELTNRLTNETIITQPAYAESAEHTVDVYAYTSFSPNGRFLTYYSPEQELIIYDIAFGTFLPSVTAVPMTPVWSPDNGRFVYQDPELGLYIYEVETKRTYALTQDGCDELRNPQWSFDGSYLSVDVPCAGTAVLQLP